MFNLHASRSARRLPFRYATGAGAVLAATVTEGEFSASSGHGASYGVRLTSQPCVIAIMCLFTPTLQLISLGLT